MSRLAISDHTPAPLSSSSSVPSSVTSSLRIQLLGTPELHWRGQPLALARRQTRALLYRLAASLVSSQPVSRDELCFLFWPDIGEGAARRQLTVLLNHLRRDLPAPDLLITAEDAISLNPAFVEVDAWQFEQTANEALRNPGITALSNAAARYRGPFLHGFALPNSAEFEAWLAQQRQTYEQRYLDVLAAMVEGHISHGDHRAAVREAQRYLDLDNHAEEMHRRLMWLYAAMGDSAAALKQFDACADVLERELNLSPSPETWALFEAVRNGTFGADSTASAAQAPSPKRKLHGRRPLPVPLNPLLGRDEDVENLCALLQDDSSRLTSLVGPGGSGKTRLALEVAACLQPTFADGVVFVSLAELREPSLLLNVVAHAFDHPPDQLCQFVQSRRLLLVLDNFEHLLPAAATIAGWLAGAPGLRILVTSRVALSVSSERVVQVPPLPLPAPALAADVAALSKQPAIALLLARVRLHTPSLEAAPDNAADLIAICTRLDGLPLALELAAARLKVLTPSEMRQRLETSLAVLTDGPRDLPERQRMLRATIDWSYQLLMLNEQRLLAHLAVFVGGCSLEAIEHIEHIKHIEHIEHIEQSRFSLDVLIALVDSSLVQRTEMPCGTIRFTMLETVREFALEQLTQCDEATAIQRAHAQYFLALAQQAELRKLRPERERWLHQLEAEHDNVRAALAWGIQEDVGLALHLAATVWPLWHVRGHFSEGRMWLSCILKLCAGRDVVPRMKAYALYGAAVLAWDQSEYATAHALAESALAICTAIADDVGRAELLCLLGDLASTQGDHDRAGALLSQSLHMGKALNDKQIVSVALGSLGVLAVNQVQFEQATTLYEECLALFRELGDAGGVAQALYALGDVHHFRGEYDLASQRFEESLILFKNLGNRRCMAWLMNKLGEIAQYRDEPARAVHIYEESLALFEELGNREGIGLVLHNLGYEALQAGDLERATALHTKSLGHFCEAGIQWGIGVAQGLLGVVAGVQGNHRLANEWLQQSLAIWQNLKNKHGIARTLNRLGEVKINEGAYGDALALHQQGLVLAQEIDNRAEIAISLQGVAATITVEEQAACLLGAAEVLRETLGLTLRPVERTYWKRIVTDVRAQLDDAAFFAAWFEGRAMTTTQAIAQALCVSRHFDERKCADLQFV